MVVSFSSLIILAALYFGGMFLLAIATNRNWLSKAHISHPATYVLSLGVFASAWSVFGSLGFAYQYGNNYLAYYFGVSIAFMLGPFLIAPILRLAKNLKLTSLADVIAFRYRSQLAGSLVTALLIQGTLSLIAMQYQALQQSIALLVGDFKAEIFLVIFAGFTMLFSAFIGVRSANQKEKNSGLVAVIALSSLIKLLGFLLLAIFAVGYAFGGLGHLNEWLVSNPNVLGVLNQPIDHRLWRGLLLAFFVAAIAMPHVYHMAVTECIDAKSLRVATWGFPAYMWLMALGVPLILWSAIKLNINFSPEYFSMGIGIHVNSPLVVLLTFIVGLVAASGICIVLSVALSGMALNHLVLPVFKPNDRRNIYQWLLRARRMLSLFTPLLAYWVYWMCDKDADLTELSLLSAIACLQCIPGLMGVFLWPRATSKGVVSGLLVGWTIWMLSLFMPMIFTDGSGNDLLNIGFSPSIDNWQFTAIFSTLLNTLTFGLVSISSPQTEAEKDTAKSCSLSTLTQPHHWSLHCADAKELIDKLATPLGYVVAKREVHTACEELSFPFDEQRPYALRRIREQVEKNLSGLLGPNIARRIIEEHIPYLAAPTGADLHLIENRLESSNNRLTGLAAELNRLRRFHRQTLEDLPIGVCTLQDDLEILSWNHAMEGLTGLASNTVLGSRIHNLPFPWKDFFIKLLDIEKNYLSQEVRLNNTSQWIMGQKAQIQTSPDDPQPSGRVFILENVTESKTLEAKLAHNDRLIAIGQLAAGVAHEIGNPVTSIACLAQEVKSDPSDIASNENAAQLILEQTQRISKILHNLVHFSHGKHHSPQPHAAINLANICHQATELINLDPNAKHINIICDCPAEVPIWGDHHEMTQVFVNLVNNAMDASEVGSTITIRCWRDEQYAHLEVCDEGSGIPDNIKDRVFDPFVTSKEPGKGTGLGLTLVYRILERHDAVIEIKSNLRAKQGTLVTIMLPIYIA